MNGEDSSTARRTGDATPTGDAPRAGTRLATASGDWLEHAAKLIGVALGSRGIPLAAGTEMIMPAAGEVYVSVCPCPDPAVGTAAAAPDDASTCMTLLLPRRLDEGVPPTTDSDVELRVLGPETRTWTPPELASLESVVAFLADDLDIRHGLTSSQQFAEELRLHSFRDTLTGLPNRILFLDRLGHAVERTKRHKDFRFAVLALDIDRFVAVNDSLGQAIGDEVLVIVARRLETCVRGEDTIGRLGRDEFVALLESISDDSDGSRVAERMRRSLAEPILTAAGEVFISASIGITLDSPELEDPAELIQQANIAASRARAAGGNRYEMYDSAMHARAIQRLRTEMDLRHAVERGEFQLYYQPLISLDTGRITELEALLRWHHPERGLVPPLDFIPLAEETGLILPIGSWVLKEACRQMCEWQREFPTEPGAEPLALSVNLSVKQFAQPGFVQHVADTIKASGLDPRSLKLEITESFIIDDSHGTRAMLEELRHLGVKIYLDDFGTGYSSLAYLHTLPLDAIKIDRSFVTGMETGRTQMQLVQTVRSLAKNIGVVAVAEGVETDAQLKTLRSLGCESAQGYLFSRPVAAPAIAELLRSKPRW